MEKRVEMRKSASADRAEAPGDGGDGGSDAFLFLLFLGWYEDSERRRLGTTTRY